MDDLYNDAMMLHSRYCDRTESPHECVGHVTLRRGEVCLDCPLCGKGEHHPWRPELVQHAKDILAAAGMKFETLNRDAQIKVLNEIYVMVKHE